LPSESSVTIRRILVPLDLNRMSEAKLPLAEAQARAFGAQLVLLHVIPSSPAPDGMPTSTESQAQSYLDAISARLRGEGTDVKSVVRFGPVVETILDEIRSLGADLLVIGSNVRRGISRLLLGSVAEELVAQSPCPVLIVRPDVTEAERTMPVRSFADDVARSGPVAPRHLGIRTVDVERIVGSVGRATELDSNFRIQTNRRLEVQRYNGILKAMESGVSLPPVVLYKLGYGYYVLDGNHRVAAAKQLGLPEIEADVTEFVPLADAQTKRVFAERRAFESTTGLTTIGAARPGSYNQIEDMIRAFAQTQPSLDLRDAAAVWHARIYLPAARVIRSLRLREHLPGYRTADIFVEVARLRESLFRELGREIDWEDAARALRDRLAAARPASPPHAARAGGA